MGFDNVNHHNTTWPCECPALDLPSTTPPTRRMTYPPYSSPHMGYCNSDTSVSESLYSLVSTGIHVTKSNVEATICAD